MGHVTISDTTPRVVYTVGSTPQSAFTIPPDWGFFALTDIKVWVDGVALSYNVAPADATEFSVTGTAVDAGYEGGTVNLGAAVSNATVIVQRDVPAERTSDFPYPSSTLDLKALNTQLDKLFALLQQGELADKRALRLDDADETESVTLPLKSARANKYFKYDADGVPVAVESVDPGSLSITAFGTSLVGALDAAAGRTVMGAAASARLVNTANGLTGGGDLSSDRTLRLAAPQFQCYLAKSGSNLALVRDGGSWLFINGQNEQIPSAGVTLGAGALSANTTYYIYAYMNAGTMTLEASATAYATDSTYGHRVKNGDATRTYVGLARTTTGPAWIDDGTNLGVLSQFNRKPKLGRAYLTANRTTTSASYTEINSEIRVNYLSDPTNLDMGLIVALWGNFQISAAGVVSVGIAANSTTAPGRGGIGQYMATAGQPYVFAQQWLSTGSGTAWNYATMLGKTSTGTATFLGAGSSGDKCELEVLLWG